ncbi:hypothetical protein Mapa_005883 [Marchantia paleacea]|nr:hypothetical protein Mapa_005883 [Marchantia paleacea]
MASSNSLIASGVHPCLSIILHTESTNSEVGFTSFGRCKSPGVGRTAAATVSGSIDGVSAPVSFSAQNPCNRLPSWSCKSNTYLAPRKLPAARKDDDHDDDDNGPHKS